MCDLTVTSAQHLCSFPTTFLHTYHPISLILVWDTGKTWFFPFADEKFENLKNYMTYKWSHEWLIEFWVINYKLCHLGKVPDGSINYHLSTIIRMILKFGNSPVMCQIASAHPPLPQRWWSPNSIPLWTWSYFKIGPLWMTKLEWSHQGRPQSILRMCRNEKDKFRHRDRRAQREDNVKTHENATYKPSNVWVYSS